MKVFAVISLLVFALALTTSEAAKAKKLAKQSNNSTTTSTTTESPPKAPSIDWGKCPQLEPKESDRVAKALVLDQCLALHPVPKNLTEESVETHQKQIAECALKKEKWFTKAGAYRFSKAETEIKNKKLAKAVESSLVKDHKKCESEAKEQFAKKEQIIDQIQLYQACMDFHITETCAIAVKQ